MANIKSAKKRAKQSEKRRLENLARRTAIKTMVKKLLITVEQKGSTEEAKNLLSNVTAKLARAKSKGALHRNTTSRKLSRLAKKVDKLENKEQSNQA